MKLFEQISYGSLAAANRIVRSATWEGMCDDEGRPGEKLRKCYAELAAGGVGLLISGYTFVSPEGKQMPGKMGIHTDDFGDAMKSLAGEVHQAGGRICMQLVHAGGQTTAAMAGRRPLAPSEVELPQFPEVPEALGGEDIERIIGDFARGAARAKEYGFDAVQLHGAHGYLISQFLSPLANQRDDRYGGDGEGRRRFLVETVQAVRHAVGRDFPVLVKLNCTDFLDGGMSEEEGLAAAVALDKEGIDAIEVSGGTPASGRRSPARLKVGDKQPEAYHLSRAAAIKSAVSCPVIAVGGFRSLSVCEEAVAEGKSDAVSLSRPLIREPDLPEKWRRGESVKAACISCNACFRPGLKEGGIYCVVAKKAREKAAEG